MKILKVKITDDVVRGIATEIATCKVDVEKADSEMSRIVSKAHLDSVIRILWLIGFPGAESTDDGFCFDNNKANEWLKLKQKNERKN